MQRHWLLGLWPLAIACSAAAHTHDHSQHQPALPAAQAGARTTAPQQAPGRPPEVKQAQPVPALEGYRPFVDAQPVDWRAANEQVRAVGGHAGAMKEGATKEGAK